MVAQKLTRAGCKRIDEEFGEEWVFERIMAGRTVASIQKEINIGHRIFYSWLHGGPKATRDETRWARYQEARRIASDTLAEETLQIADECASPEEVGIAKLKIDTRKWLAGAMNPETYGNLPATQVNLSLGDMHIQALKDVVSASQDALPHDED
jgi:hypothetical protein